MLAAARLSGATAVLDDAAARTIASEEGIAITGSVGLICSAVRDHGLKLDSASRVADTLLRTEYRLPFAEGGFKAFVLENDYLPYDG